MIFLYVPNEKIMGAVQRVFYFHLGSVMACYLSVVVMLVGAIGLLVANKKIFANLNQAAGETGFLFATGVMLTGMIWGQAAWNSWFEFDPRLVSFLIIWLMLLGFNILIKFGNPEKIEKHSAVLAILIAISLPLSIYSVHLWPAIKQIHPQVLPKRGLPEASMRYTLLLSVISMLVFCGFLITLRTRIIELEEKVRNKLLEN